MGEDCSKAMRSNSVEATLVPARFLCTMTYTIATCMVFYSREQNILASIGGTTSSADYTDADTSMVYALVVAMLCFFIQYWGLLGGFSMFFHKVNALHVALNFCGALSLVFFIVENFGYEHYWTIVGLFSIVPMIFETGIMMTVPFFKGLQY